jgi:hypothetical protein
MSSLEQAVGGLVNAKFKLYAAAAFWLLVWLIGLIPACSKFLGPRFIALPMLSNMSSRWIDSLGAYVALEGPISKACKACNIAWDEAIELVQLYTHEASWSQLRML